MGRVRDSGVGATHLASQHLHLLAQGPGEASLLSQHCLVMLTEHLSTDRENSLEVIGRHALRKQSSAPPCQPGRTCSSLLPLEQMGIVHFPELRFGCLARKPVQTGIVLLLTGSLC